MSRLKKQNLQKVELIPAFLWDCPECGKENFERTVVAELSQEELIELKFEHGVEPNSEGNFLTSPTSVDCRHCGTSFNTVDYGQSDEAD